MSITNILYEDISREVQNGIKMDFISPEENDVDFFTNTFRSVKLRKFLNALNGSIF